MQVLALCKIVLVEVDDFSTNTFFNLFKNIVFLSVGGNDEFLHFYTI